MKVKSCILCVVLFLSVVSLVGCDGGGGGPTSPSFTPTSGVWTGTNIQFFVSSDSSKITTQGSSLRRSSSLILGPVPMSGACPGSSVTIYLDDEEIPINNLSFEYNVAGLVIKGQFSSSTTASGTWSYNYSSSCSGSGNWSASK